VRKRCIFAALAEVQRAIKTPRAKIERIAFALLLSLEAITPRVAPKYRSAGREETGTVLM
jgi:hypothetical protein